MEIQRHTVKYNRMRVQFSSITGRRQPREVSSWRLEVDLWRLNVWFEHFMCYLSILLSFFVPRPFASPRWKTQFRYGLISKSGLPRVPALLLLSDFLLGLLLYSDDRSSTFFWNIDKCLPGFKASHCRQLYYSQSSSWELQNQQISTLWTNENREWEITRTVNLSFACSPNCRSITYR
jgi:hypothetical protein